MLLLENLALGFAKRKIFVTLWKTHGLVTQWSLISEMEGKMNRINSSLSLIHSLDMINKQTQFQVKYF